MNSRTLDGIFPTLDPILSEADQSVARELSDVMNEAEFFIIGHGYGADAFYLVFSDGDRTLRYSLREQEALVEALREGGTFPWEEELRRQPVQAISDEAESEG